MQISTNTLSKTGPNDGKMLLMAYERRLERRGRPVPLNYFGRGTRERFYESPAASVLPEYSRRV